MVNLKTDFKWAVLTSIIPGVLIGFLALPILLPILCVWPFVLMIEIVTGMTSVGISLSRSRISSRSDSLATGAVSGLMASLIGVAVFVLLEMYIILALTDISGFFIDIILIFSIPGIIAGALGGLAYYYLRRH